MKRIFYSALMIFQLTALTSAAQSKDLGSLREQLASQSVKSVAWFAGTSPFQFSLPGDCRQYNSRDVFKVFVHGAKAAVTKTLAARGIQVASMQVSSRYQSSTAVTFAEDGGKGHEVSGALQMQIRTSDGANLSGLSIGERSNNEPEDGFNLGLEDHREYNNEGAVTSSQCLVFGANRDFIIYNSETKRIVATSDDFLRDQIFDLKNILEIYSPSFPTLE